MKTNSLNDLKKLVPVASARVGNNIVTVNGKQYIRRTLTVEYSVEEFFRIVSQLIKEVYHDNVQYVNQLLQRIYKRPIRFKGAISDFLIKIKTIMNQTGKTIEQIIASIRNYLGYNASFSRYQGEKLVLITSDRILEAYKLVENKESLIKVENVLYL